MILDDEIFYYLPKEKHSFYDRYDDNYLVYIKWSKKIEEDYSKLADNYLDAETEFKKAIQLTGLKSARPRILLSLAILRKIIMKLMVLIGIILKIRPKAILLLLLILSFIMVKLKDILLMN